MTTGNYVIQDLMRLVYRDIYYAIYCNFNLTVMGKNNIKDYSNV